MTSQPTLRVEKTEYAPKFRGEWHHHRNAQLIYPSRGAVTIHTQKGSWVVPPSRACWLKACEPHSVETCCRLDMHSVYCEGLLLLQQLPRETGIVQVSGLLRELILGLHRAAAVPLASERIDRMAVVLADEIELQQSSDLRVPPLLSRRLKPIANALAQDPADPRTSSEWAVELGLSTRTLARAFQREARMSFVAYRRQIRLRAAMERLVNGDSVSAIAYDLGFSSASNFISMFREITGTTPRRYCADKKANAASGSAAALTD